MKDRGQKPAMSGRQLLLGLGVMALLAGIMTVGLAPRTAPPTEENPSAAQVDAAEVKLAEGCQVVQRMIYTPCGHETTRRQPLPQELVGATRAEAEAAYDDWQLTGFSAAELSMEQNFDFYCAQHQVLMPDASGMLCVFENRYGDALALVRTLDTPLSALPEAVQEELRAGKGFDSAEELERWLESIES